MKSIRNVEECIHYAVELHTSIKNIMHKYLASLRKETVRQGHPCLLESFCFNILPGIALCFNRDFIFMPNEKVANNRMQ